MKRADVLLVIVAVLLVLIATELVVIINTGNVNAKLAASSSQELAASNGKLETVMTNVGEQLEIVVNKFCGGRKKK